MNRSWSRYAPSPTGPLHLGNLQTALAAWLQARLEGAGFILRIEDLDSNRCRPVFIESIVGDLRRMGFDWDIGPGVSPERTYLQSLRYDLYHATLDRLADLGRLYACGCTRRDLREVASAPHGPLGLIYPGTCRPGEPDSRFDWRDAGGASQSVRFRCEPGAREFNDRLVGRVRCEISSDVGDFIVYRRDGMVAYHLAVVVDDMAMHVTDVLRGQDLLWSVFPQDCVYDVLGAPRPRYWHVPLRLDEAGRRLAKRSGGATLQDALDGGSSIPSVIGTLAHGLGLIDRAQPITLLELLAELDADRFLQRLRSAVLRSRGEAQEA